MYYNLCLEQRNMTSISAVCSQAIFYLLSPMWLMKLFYETCYHDWFPCPAPCTILTTLKFVFLIFVHFLNIEQNVKASFE